MQGTPEHRIEIELRSSSDWDATPLRSSGGVPELVYILFLIPGVFVSLLALGAYPPLHRRLPMAVLLSLFLLPVVLQVLGSMRKTSSEHPHGKTKYLLSSVALLLLALILDLNGKLDRSPANEVRMNVIRKTVSRGRTTGYDLAVSSSQNGASS